MSINIKGGGSANLLDVDVSGNTKVVTVTNIDNAGFFNAISRSGDITSATTLREYYNTQDYRRASGVDKVLWDDTFADTVVDTSRYMCQSTSSSIGMVGSRLVLNSTTVTTAGAVQRVQTFKTFPLASAYPLYVDIVASIKGTLETRHNFEFGLGFPTSNTTPVTDGIFFRYSGGTNNLYSVTSYNSIEVQQNLNVTLSSDRPDRFRIVINENQVEFWMNGVLKNKMTPPATSGGTVLSNSLPLMFKNMNVSTPSAGLQLGICSATVSLGDVRSNKGWATVAATRGMSAVSEPEGRTGQTSSHINSSTAATISVLSNTQAGYTNLGGQFQFIVPTSGETDYVLFGYYSTAPTANTVSRNLLITDIKIESYNMGAANSASPILLQWAVAIGGTAESLATSDSATAGSRGPRKFLLGTQMIASSAAIGAASDRSIDVNLKSPLLVEPGTYLHLLFKVPVCIPASAVHMVRGIAQINGYFE